MSRTVAWSELVFGFALAAASAALFVDSLDLPPPRFDVLGSAAVPRALCVILIGMAVFLALHAIFGLLRVKKLPAPLSDDDQILLRPRSGLAVATLGLVLIYTGLLQHGVANYGVLTSIFLFLVAIILSSGQRKIAIFAFSLACIVGFGGEYIFNNIFLIDLP